MTMLLQVGPETVEAHRVLSDGRHLAVFKCEPGMRLAELPRAVGICPTAEGFELVTEGQTRVEPEGPVEYELVVSDNTDEPLKWRRLGDRVRRLKTALKRFAEFKEGDDDRRAGRQRGAGEGRDLPHPERRQGDRREDNPVPAV